MDLPLLQILPSDVLTLVDFCQWELQLLQSLGIRPEKDFN